MPSRQSALLPSEPPTLTAEKAIPLIQRQIERLTEIDKLSYDDPQIGVWQRFATNLATSPQLSDSERLLTRDLRVISYKSDSLADDAELLSY